MNENALQIATIAVEQNRAALETILLRKNISFHQYSTNDVMIGELVEIYRRSPDLFMDIMQEFPYNEEKAITEANGGIWATLLSALLGGSTSGTPSQTQKGSNTAVLIGGGALIVVLIGLAVWYMSKTN